MNENVYVWECACVYERDWYACINKHIHIHIHMYIHMHIHTCTCTFTHAHAHMHIHTCTCTFTHAHAHSHMHMHIHKHTLQDDLPVVVDLLASRTTDAVQAALAVPRLAIQTLQKTTSNNKTNSNRRNSSGNAYTRTTSDTTSNTTSTPSISQHGPPTTTPPITPPPHPTPTQPTPPTTTHYGYRPTALEWDLWLHPQKPWELKKWTVDHGSAGALVTQAVFSNTVGSVGRAAGKQHIQGHGMSPVMWLETFARAVNRAMMGDPERPLKWGAGTQEPWFYRCGGSRLYHILLLLLLL